MVIESKNCISDSKFTMYTLLAIIPQLEKRSYQMDATQILLEEMQVYLDKKMWNFSGENIKISLNIMNYEKSQKLLYENYGYSPYTIGYLGINLEYFKFQ